jgi:hypothetical protein
MPARILTLAAAIIVVLVAAATTAAKDTISFVLVNLALGDHPALSVKSETLGRSGLSFSFISIGQTATTASGISIDFAPGYSLPTLPPASSAGSVFLASSTGSQGGASLLGGILTIEDPATYATDPSAQVCAPGPYLAVWKLTTSALGLSLTLHLFVEHPAGDATRIEIRFCPPPLSNSQGQPVTTGPMPISDANFELFGVRGPATPGSYVSSAYITPSDATGAAEQASTVEARALEPVPHSVTLKGSYDTKNHSAVLTGKVIQAGKPQARAVVELVVGSLPPRRVKTNARGTFSTRVRMPATTTYAARVVDATGPCGGTSTAPAGCASLTVTGTNTVQVTVGPRR